MNDIRFPRAHQEPESSAEVYNLSTPDRAFCDCIMETIEQHGEGRPPAVADVGARLLADGFQTNASPSQYWGERHIYVQPDDDPVHR